MQKPQVFVQRALMTVMVIALVATAGYFAFRRTLIADLREAAIAPDTSDLTAYGEILFQTRGCVGCHTLDRASARGDEGPDLSHIASRADTAYVYTSIASPGAVIATGCPDGPCEAGIMPQYGTFLTDAQISALVAYLMAG